MTPPHLRPLVAAALCLGLGLGPGLSACATAPPSIETLEDRRQGSLEQWRAHLAGPDAARAARAMGRLRRPDFALPLAAVRGPARAEAVFALGQLADLTDVTPLRSAAAHDDPTIRARALEALGKQGDDLVLPLLVEGLSDPDPGVRAAAALALARVRGRRTKDKHPAPMPDGLAAELQGSLHERLDREDDPDARWALVYALSELPLPNRLPLLRIVVSEPDPRIRLFAIRGMTRAGGEPTDFQLALSDPDPHVRAAAEAALAPTDGAKEEETPLSRQAALTQVADPDIKLRDEAIVALAKAARPEDLAVIERAYDSSPGDEYAEPRATAVRSAAEHYKEAALPLVRKALADRSPAVAHAAGKALHALTGAPPPPPPLVPGRSSSYQPHRLPSPSSPNPRATLHTEKGDIVLELLPAEAPRHVAMFLDFAKSGRYEGLTIHRVVPGFVVQGLDPRGDGWGTGGVFLRHEINPVPYRTGTVGMPNAGPDSGGCQIFITHIPTPHLDGRYTVFAQVIEGMEVVHTLAVGDAIASVGLVGAAGSPNERTKSTLRVFGDQRP